MDILSALISEKWLLAAIALSGYFLERKERLADKEAFRRQREAFTQRLATLSDVLLVINERIK